MQEAVVVVPCYNEERRIDDGAFLPLLAREGVGVVFVDDGSTDDTAGRLGTLVARAPERMRLLRLDRNRGKAEAVRHGMLEALARGARVVGYMDADASTPPGEVLRLLDTLEARGAEVVMGARVQLLGSEVTRRRSRHYLGRIFATAASAMLSLPVYDTQCGAKLFLDTPSLRAALSEPFASRWVFDVELLGRLLLRPPEGSVARARFVEVPLGEWCDVAGSKLGLKGMLQSGAELLAVGAKLGRARRKQRSQKPGKRTEP